MIQVSTPRRKGIEVVKGGAKRYQYCRPERSGKNIRLERERFTSNLYDGRGVREKLKERAESTEKMLNETSSGSSKNL